MSKQQTKTPVGSVGAKRPAAASAAASGTAEVEPSPSKKPRHDAKADNDDLLEQEVDTATKNLKKARDALKWKNQHTSGTHHPCYGCGQCTPGCEDAKSEIAFCSGECKRPICGFAHGFACGRCQKNLVCEDCGTLCKKCETSERLETTRVLEQRVRRARRMVQMNRDALAKTAPTPIVTEDDLQALCDAGMKADEATLRDREAMLKLHRALGLDKKDNSTLLAALRSLRDYYDEVHDIKSSFAMDHAVTVAVNAGCEDDDRSFEEHGDSECDSDYDDSKSPEVLRLMRCSCKPRGPRDLLARSACRKAIPGLTCRHCGKAAKGSIEYKELEAAEAAATAAAKTAAASASASTAAAAAASTSKP